MVGARFQFGWWPAKIVAFFNVITLLGWSVINCVFGGQILAAISDQKVPIEVGITIITVISIVIAIFGIRYVQYAESFCAAPVIVTFVLLYICAAPHFDTTTPSVGDSPTIIANWLSNFSSCMGITATWIAITSDYFVDFPETIPSGKIFTLTTFSIFIPTAFVGILGIALGAAAVSDSAWLNAYNSLGNGGLLNAAFSAWHGGGKFLLVVLYISLVTNNILNTYSIALSMQVWGRFFTRVPRFILAFSDAIVYFVLAMAGRNKLSNILSSFLPMITYWVVIYFAILLEENFLFRRRKLPGCHDGYDWSLWNDKRHMPSIYWAAFAAYLCGIAGAIVGMCQTYFVGPIAAKLGSYGGDIGIFLSFGFTALVYPVFRNVEIKIVGHV
jgi:NCS1 nucleoside transporter family